MNAVKRWNESRNKSTIGASMSKKKKFRVYISQVNQTYVDVEATDKDSAEEAAKREWKREYAHPRIMSIEENDRK